MANGNGADKGVSAVGYAASVAVVFCVVLMAFCGGRDDLARDYRTLDPVLVQPSGGVDGGAGPLSAREYVDLQLDIYAQREIMQLRFASILLALLCVSTGVGLLLAASASPGAMTVERLTKRRLLPDVQNRLDVGTVEETETSPTLGTPAVGLLLVIIGALVVLLAPRGPAPREERARAAEPPREAVDAGTPPAQTPAVDAGVPAH
jgi:hypothetical protein